MKISTGPSGSIMIFRLLRQDGVDALMLRLLRKAAHLPRSSFHFILELVLKLQAIESSRIRTQDLNGYLSQLHTYIDYRRRSAANLIGPRICNGWLGVLSWILRACMLTRLIAALEVVAVQLESIIAKRLPDSCNKALFAYLS